MAKWWPFGKKSEEEKEAESQFLEMLHEASVRTDDLKHMTKEIRADRLKRIRDSRRPQQSSPELAKGVS